MVFVTRLISMTNFAVASSALGFQVFVLYPWHKELDASFEELRKEHLKVLAAVSGGRVITRQEGQAMQERVSRELAQHMQGEHKSWWSQYFARH
ncbi:hypothetical protein MAPG_04674 [Magnaporthiopsis poae ATCC 64411]|uniref:Mitochondrial phosphate carrier protein n=1 Tax=Magnaporthiopsis poae (strain ATCC 64411 / 73-15) TaxID=644358 RepID=A0A0C4DXD1_MAGP6|nr:hypothetical protein MAPG_04674 [Magnaporthiopsis poae ATCC 64411]